MIVTLSLEILLLTASASLPRELLQENMKTSADFLCQKPPFFYLTKKDVSSRIDRHADAILLNIAYCYDSSSPFLSVIKSSYYYDAYKNENENLLYRVQNESTPTYDYMRYWHGSLAFIRPLFIFFSLQEIYVINACLLALLILVSCLFIRKDFDIATSLCFFIACILSTVWYVPFSLEYMPVFVITLLAIPLLSVLNHRFPGTCLYAFLVLGSVTSYTDFLTTETITLLIPLILFVLKENEKKILFCIKSGICWLIGYSVTWSFKWALYSLTVSSDGLSDAVTQTAYRTGGAYSDSMNFIQQINGSLLRNVRCLFPFSVLNDTLGFVLPPLLLLAIAMVFYIIKKQKNMPDIVLVLFLIGLLPYLRYVVLSNHSYIHYFFTFRAQLVSIFCLLLIFRHGTDTAFLQKQFKKLKNNLQNKRKKRR